jgi:hypothetical protein
MLALADPALIWGVFTRLVGLVYLIAIASLWHQILPICGPSGIAPIAPQLRKIARDFPAPQRYFYFPTLLWINASDRFLRILIAAGACAAVAVIVGGSATPLALLVCWLVYLSLDSPAGLVYPWDTVLLEAGFLALLLPSLHVLPDLSATAAAPPVVAWTFHWLLFRVIFGFGKFKFLGASHKDTSYIHGFLVNQPLPTPLGWYAHHLPRWVHRFALVAMFAVEVLVPFLIFIPGPPRLLAAVAISALMIGIQLVGNFGFFNLLVVTLCVALLDVHASLFGQPFADWFGWDRALPVAVALVVFVGGLLNLPFNSWCARSWLYWPSQLNIRARWLRGLLACYRALSPYRIVQAYGVFPPMSSPPVRWAIVIEGTADGLEWREYRYRFMPSSSQAPRFLAPYHPRYDHAIFYEAFGTGTNNFLTSVFGVGNPYQFSRASGLERTLQRLLEGNAAVTGLFANNPFPDAPPLAIRAELYVLRPVGLAEHQRTGAWWRREFVAPHLPARARDERIWQDWLLDPELFHWDEIFWKRRAPSTRELMRRTRAGGDTIALATDARGEITCADVALFWESFVPVVQCEQTAGWAGMPEAVLRIRSAYSYQQLRRFERIVARLSLALATRLEEHFSGRQHPAIELTSYFHLGMLAHSIICAGREAFETALREPSVAAGYVDSLTDADGLFLTGLLWYELIRFHARKFRLTRLLSDTTYQDGMPGFVALIPFLARQFEDDERLPVFAQRPSDGEWLIIERDGMEQADGSGRIALEVPVAKLGGLR